MPGKVSKMLWSLYMAPAWDDRRGVMKPGRDHLSQPLQYFGAPGKLIRAAEILCSPKGDVEMTENCVRV